MHAEQAEISVAAVDAIQAARAAGGRCIPIGTTALRTLESAAAGGSLQAFNASTSIFITPGYRFRGIDGLMTNFHLPRSTLFMLTCAFAGTERMRAAYASAIAAGSSAAADVLMSAATSDESVPGVSTDESGDDEEDDCNDLGEFLLDAAQWLL